MTYHKSVFLHQSIDLLDLQEGGIYVDVTYGGGGHSKEILNRLQNCSLIAFDQDEDALKNKIPDDRLLLVHSNFSEMEKYLTLYQMLPVDGILADLGVSSHQFDDEKRGFSIRANEKLDMRMGKKVKKNAYEVLNTYSKEELVRVIKNHSDLITPARIANAIIKKVEEKQMNTTGDLMDATRYIAEKGKEHKFFAQLFQAIRMEVNDELDVLKAFLEQSAKVLKPGGKLVVIAYHSIEDRLIKNFMKTGSFDGEAEKDLFGVSKHNLKMLTKKPLVPDEDELEENNRSRSAKMRVAVKK